MDYYDIIDLYRARQTNNGGAGVFFKNPYLAACMVCEGLSSNTITYRYIFGSAPNWYVSFNTNSKLFYNATGGSTTANAIEEYLFYVQQLQMIVFDFKEVLNLLKVTLDEFKTMDMVSKDLMHEKRYPITFPVDNDGNDVPNSNPNHYAWNNIDARYKQFNDINAKRKFV